MFGVLTGSIVNGIAIVVGSLIGLFFHKISDETKKTVIQVMGIAILVLGIQMAMSTKSFIPLLVCVSVGAILGEYWQIEDRIIKFGDYLEKKLGKSHDGTFSEAFVTATLLFLIGSMGIIGAIESGASNDHTTLFTKAVMDGVMSIMMTSTLGIGVILSAPLVFLYQGLIALLANVFFRFIPNDLIAQLMPEISAIGGILIIGISLNLLKIITVKVSNVLPAIVLIIGYISFIYFF